MKVDLPAPFGPVRPYRRPAEKVVVTGKYRARIKATGRTAESDWAHIHTLRGGKIAQFREFTDTANAVEAYAAMHWTHMRTEETEVLPRAEKTFTADDWKIVDAAFGSHGDPLLGVDRGTQYEALFRRIVNLAPPPIGVGPERY